MVEESDLLGQLKVMLLLTCFCKSSLKSVMWDFLFALFLFFFNSPFPVDALLSYILYFLLLGNSVFISQDLKHEYSDITWSEAELEE